MKNPLIDLKDPRVQVLINVSNKRAKLAYDVATIFEDAVRPVYAVLRPTERPRQIGSCVALKFSGEIFLFSASHVFDPIGNHAVLIACGDKLHPLTGDRFSSLRGKSGTHRDDPIDASVFHIHGNIPSEIQNSALAEEYYLNSKPPSDEKCFHVAMGYRGSKSKLLSKGYSSIQDKFPSIEHDDDAYTAIGVEKEKYLAMAYESQILVDGKWQISPSPKGMSGGAIVKISGVPADPGVSPALVADPKLVAIIIEHRSEKGDAPATLLGVRIGFHLGFIQRYLPHLFARWEGSEDDESTT